MSFVFPEPEQNERAAALGLDIIPGTFGEGFGAAFDDAMVRNPTATIGRAANRLQYLPSTDEFGNEMPARTPSRKLTAQEANDKYGVEGHLKFDADIPEPIAQELKALKQRELERQDAMRRSQSGIGTSLSAGLVATLLDPLNIASAFVPVVGQTRYAAMVAQYGWKARFAVGGVEGAAGALLLEPVVLAGAQYEQADYDILDSLANVAFGTALGSGLHMAGGAVTDRLAARRGASTIERQVDDLPRADQEALARTAVAQMVEGRPVDVGPILDSSPQVQRVRAVETPEFKAWFGESKVVDPEGQPLVVYHGTKSDFTEFENKGSGIFFTASKDSANVYATVGRVEDGANVMPVFVSLKNPLVVDAPDWARTGSQYFDSTKGGLLEDAVAGGHDGLIVRASTGPDDAPVDTSIYVALEPTQVKSAIGNSGRFDPASPSLTDQPSNIAARADENVRYTDPDDAASADTTTRRVSEEAGQARPLADDLKAIEDELAVYESLIPADREAPGTSPAEKEARVRAKAYKAAAACAVRKG